MSPVLQSDAQPANGAGRGDRSRMMCAAVFAEPGLTIGHEPVGVIEKLGSQVGGFQAGQRVIAGAIRPSGHSAACLCGLASQNGTDEIVDFAKGNPVDEVMRLTEGRGVDVAIEALGGQEIFSAALRVLRPGGTLSSLGVHSSDLTIPSGAFAAGLGDHRIVTTLCPGGKERMRRLIDVVASRRVDLGPLVTSRFLLEHIRDAYEPFSHQRDGILKVAITL